MSGDSKKSKPPTRLKGRLLLADPSLSDGIFDHSVVLITHHTPEDGAHGVILNHPGEQTVGSLLKAPEFEPLQSLRVFQGGPVAQGQLTLAAFSWQATRGLRYQISIPLEKAIAHSRRPGTLVRAFAGYSGWTAGQLESELERNAWIVVKPGEDLLGLDHSPALWSVLMRRISPFHHILAASPTQPWLN
ncbi:MAG: YqgE/AlgH family protein [Luteolibacter sp.]